MDLSRNHSLGVYFSLAGKTRLLSNGNANIKGTPAPARNISDLRAFTCDEKILLERILSFYIWHDHFKDWKYTSGRTGREEISVRGNDNRNILYVTKEPYFNRQGEQPYILRFMQGADPFFTTSKFPTVLEEVTKYFTGLYGQVPDQTGHSLAVSMAVYRGLQPENI